MRRQASGCRAEEEQEGEKEEGEEEEDEEEKLRRQIALLCGTQRKNRMDARTCLAASTAATATVRPPALPHCTSEQLSRRRATPRLPR